MKKLLFGLIAIVMFGFVGNAKDISERDLTHPEKVTIRLDIKWGRVSYECRKFGICDVDGEITIERNSGLSGGADDLGNFTVYIDPTAAASIKKYFGGDKIIIDENFMLSPEACKALGLRPEYTIKLGVYKLVPSNTVKGGYSVTF